MSIFSKWADLFDEIHRDNQSTIRRGFEGWVQDEYRSHGDGSWQVYGAALTAGVAEALYTVAASFGQGMVDLLRLGEGVKKGTITGVGQDALRLVTVFGGAFRVMRLAASSVAIGGLRSCTISSSAKAAILTGNSLRLGRTFDSMSHVFGGTPITTNPLFRGAFIREMFDFFRLYGMRYTVHSVHTLTDVTALARLSRGPVLFSVEWAAKANVPGGAHTMVAFRTLTGEIRYADQFGRTVARVSEVGPVARVFSEAVIMSDAAILEVLRGGAYAQHLAAVFYTVSQEGMDALENAVRKKANRNQRTNAKGPSGTYSVNTESWCQPSLSEGPPICITRRIKTYQVGPGDHLEKISQLAYGSPKYAQSIYAANRGTIGANPNLLRAGVILRIP